MILLLYEYEYSIAFGVHHRAPHHGTSLLAETRTHTAGSRTKANPAMVLVLPYMVIRQV